MQRRYLDNAVSLSKFYSALFIYRVTLEVLHDLEMKSLCGRGSK